MEITRKGKTYNIVHTSGSPARGGYKEEMARAAFEYLSTISSDYMDNVTVTITYDGEPPRTFELAELPTTYEIKYSVRSKQTGVITGWTEAEAIAILRDKLQDQSIMIDGVKRF